MAHPKEITLKYPDYMAEDAIEKIKSLFNEVEMKRKEVADLRMKATFLEQELKEKERTLNLFTPLLDIRMENQNIEGVKNECNLGIINHSDYRNKH